MQEDSNDFDLTNSILYIPFDFAGAFMYEVVMIWT